MIIAMIAAGWQYVSGKRLRFSIVSTKTVTLNIGNSSNLITPTTQVPENLLLFLLIAPVIPVISRKFIWKKSKA